MRIWPLRKRYTQVLFEASAGTGVLYRLPLGNSTCLEHGKHPFLVALLSVLCVSRVYRMVLEK